MNKVYYLLILIVFQSCYFGVGLVETEIEDDYFLFANNSLEELSVWLKDSGGTNELIIPQTVFAIGNNERFIIAKSHPFDSETGIDRKTTFYHIIEIDKKSTSQSQKLTYAQFVEERERLKISEELEFHTIFDEVK